MLMSQFPTESAIISGNLMNTSFGDRFIPSRNRSFLDDSRVLAIGASLPDCKTPSPARLPLGARHSAPSTPCDTSMRLVPNTAERVLDAPELQKDFYLNVLHWGPTGKVAVGLGRTAFVWDPDPSGGGTAQFELRHLGIATAVRWSRDGSRVAIGTDSGHTQIFDPVAERSICTLPSPSLLTRPSDPTHDAIISLLWREDSLITGQRDGHIAIHDIRSPQSVAAVWRGHDGKVCGMDGAADDCEFTTGANDDRVCVWDISALRQRRTQPRLALNAHRAAVKALAYAPWSRRCLVTGGGTYDGTVKVWSTATGELLREIDTNSQVCGLAFGRSGRDHEIVTAHGYGDPSAGAPIANSVCVWRYPSMQRVGTLCGHTDRVLHLSSSPCGELVCSAGADETLRFWRVWAAGDRAPGATMHGLGTRASASVAVRPVTVGWGAGGAHRAIR